MLKPQAERDPFKARKQKTIIGLFIILLMLTFGAFYYVSQREKPLPPSYEVCELDQSKIIEQFIEYKYPDKLVIKDFFYYGETLSLFEEKYNIQEKSSLLGKTIVLENVCSDEEYFYLIDDDVDGQIPLDQLPEGFYEVFVNIDMVKKRVTTADKFKETINLVRRNDKNINVEIIADKNIFDDKEHEDYLDDNYMFISVKNMENSSQDYDIVLDPQYGNNDNGWFENFGPLINDKRVADELYDFSTVVKTELEKAGLKVLITRKSIDDIVSVYGKDGRLDRAYASKAKYYIELGFGEADQGGLKVFNSSFSSMHFAGSMAKYLLSNTNLESPNDSGVYTVRRSNGLDGDMVIREIGGKALSAATYSDLAKTENASFAFENPYGLESISIELFSVKDQAQVITWEENKNVYAKALAQGLLDFLDIGEDNDISD